MCGKLPHVETLSSPDNYSLWNVYKETFTEIHGGYEARIILISTTVTNFFLRDEIELDVFTVADPEGWET